jgi:vacuolar-type H+-ATPase subunit H
VTILERIRPERRVNQFGRIAQDLMTRDQVKDIREAAADAIDAVQQFAADAAERAGDAVGDAVDNFGSEASKVTGNAAKDVARVAKDVQLDKHVDRGLDKVDGRVDDLVDRIRQALPTERISTLVTNLERELPNTDKDRYDRAFGRGFARARTSFVIVGAATGIAAGIAGAYLLDPQRGTQRRNALRTKLRRTTEDVTTQVRRTATLTADRARGFAHERGLIKADGETDESFDRSATAPLVPVMDASVATTPVMPLGDGPVTDPASIEREPMTTPDGGLIGGSPADGIQTSGFDDARLPVDANATTASLEPEAADATLTGDESERGTWHRTM